MNSGIHNITIEQYHSGPGISRSGIVEFKKSPLHFWHKYINPERPISEPTDAMLFGNAVHCYILEPHTFQARYHVWQKVNGRKPASNTKGWDDIVTAANRKLLISEDDLVEITNMARSLNSSATAKGVIDGAVYEQSLFWTDVDTGILCKVRPDIWHSNMIGDLKTARSAHPCDFQRDIWSFGYHLQAGMTSEALWSLQGANMMNFVFPVVEKYAPYATAVYKLDENAVNKGREEFKKALFEIKDCMVNDHWPSYPDQIIDLPTYAYNNKGEI